MPGNPATRDLGSERVHYRCLMTMKDACVQHAQRLADGTINRQFNRLLSYVVWLTPPENPPTLWLPMAMMTHHPPL